MVLNKYNKQQIKSMSMIKVANKVLADEKKEMNFIDLFNKVATIKNLTESEKTNFLSNFYTDLNVDGRFTTLGSNLWGLKRWYPVDQTSEKLLAESRKRDLEEEELIDEDYNDLDGDEE